jgi:hypothetical protein
MNKKDLEALFDIYVENVRKRIGKKYKNIYITQYNYEHSSGNKAMFIVRRGTQYIELYKPSIIAHYLKYYPDYISFGLYFTSIIIHEFVHREQYIKEFYCNFKLFNIRYQCYKEKYETQAREREKHFIEFILKYRKLS